MFDNNIKRKCSVYYGSQSVNKLLEDNVLICMVRAHEVHMDGYKLYNWNGEKEVPCVVSIFGAPNYCDVYKNQSSCLYYKGEKR